MKTTNNYHIKWRLAKHKRYGEKSNLKCQLVYLYFPKGKTSILDYLQIWVMPFYKKIYLWEERAVLGRFYLFFSFFLFHEEIKRMKNHQYSFFWFSDFPFVDEDKRHVFACWYVCMCGCVWTHMHQVADVGL